jgi:hypothetical protein
MKQLHFLRMAALAIAFPLPAVLFGQDFVNGGFEKNGNMCLINTSVAVFNANMKNTHAFGSFRRPDIASTNCGQGDAKEGNWFIGLATNIETGVTSEAVTLELSQPLVKGTQYTLSFWTRGRTETSNLEVGLSNNDSTQGHIFYTVAAASIGNSWGETVIRFTAPDNGKYISVRATNNNANSGVWLDGFKMSTVFVPDNVVMMNPVNKNTVPANHNQQKAASGSTIGELYPNPSSGVFKVNADSNALISLTVFNTLGSTVEEHKATDVEPIPGSIDLSDQQPGLYFVELATLEGKVTKRIIVSR